MSDILKYSSWLTAYLLICGCLKFYLYYKTFHISILRFVDFSEILTLFMDNLFGYISISIPIIITTVLIYFRLKPDSVNLLPQAVFEHYIKEYATLITLFGISVFALIIYYFKSYSVSKGELLLIFAALIFLILIYPFLIIYAQRLINSYLGFSIQFKYTFLIALSLVLLLYTIATAYNEANKVLNRNYYRSVICKIDDKEIASSNEYFFIGKTKGFVFFYNKIKKRCDVFLADKVKMYSF